MTPVAAARGAAARAAAHRIIASNAIGPARSTASTTAAVRAYRPIQRQDRRFEEDRSTGSAPASALVPVVSASSRCTDHTAARDRNRGVRADLQNAASAPAATAARTVGPASPT